MFYFIMTAKEKKIHKTRETSELLSYLNYVMKPENLAEAYQSLKMKTNYTCTSQLDTTSFDNVIRLILNWVNFQNQIYKLKKTNSFLIKAIHEEKCSKTERITILEERLKSDT